MTVIVNIIQNLFKIDVNNYHQLPDEICSTMINTIPDLQFVSLLTYNKQTDELIYRSIKFDEKRYNKKTITDLIEPHIILKVSKSTSGRLISSNERFLLCQDVLNDDDFQSRDLAVFLRLQAAIFIKLHDVMTKDIYGILILYPSKSSPIVKFSDAELLVLASIIESILSSAKRIKEAHILSHILEAAKKVRKDLSSFLQKCVEITSTEIRAEGCSIFVVDPIDQLIKLKATLGIIPGPRYKKQFMQFTRNQVFYKMGEGNTGKIAETNIPLIKHSMDISNSKWIEKSMSSTFLGVPVFKIDENKAIGVIRCATRPNTLIDQTLEAFNHEDVQLVTYIATLLSTFIELSFYHEQQKQFITKMPHEIKASLANIVAICDYIRLISSTSEVRHSSVYKILERKLDDIMSESELSKMTLNSLSAFEDSIEAYDFELTDIFTGIIAKVRKMLNPLAETERKIKIDYDNQFGLPRLYVDKHRIQLVFHNLLINAIKYSYHNKSNILIRSDVSKDKQHYLVSISNYGIPVHESQKEAIFINGFRSLEAIMVNPGGTGWGLALVKQILQVHNSMIRVTSLSDPTTFTVFFPYELAKRFPRDNDQEQMP